MSIEPKTTRPLPRRDAVRQNVRRSVVDYIKELIFEGDLPPGTRVPQDDIAAALGVSNTPVREAILSLEHEGIVRIELHRGAFVNDFDARTVRLRYELYGLIWSWALRRAVQDATPSQIERLVEQAAPSRTTSDPAEMFASIGRVADVLEEVCGSHDWRRLLERLPQLVPGVAVYAIPDAMDAAATWLGPMVEAIAARDADRAVECGNRFNEAHGAALIAELQRRSLIDEE